MRIFLLPLLLAMPLFSSQTQVQALDQLTVVASPNFPGVNPDMPRRQLQFDGIPPGGNGNMNGGGMGINDGNANGLPFDNTQQQQGDMWGQPNQPGQMGQQQGGVPGQQQQGDMWGQQQLQQQQQQQQGDMWGQPKQPGQMGQQQGGVPGQPMQPGLQGQQQQGGVLGQPNQPGQIGQQQGGVPGQPTQPGQMGQQQQGGVLGQPNQPGQIGQQRGGVPGQPTQPGQMGQQPGMTNPQGQVPLPEQPAETPKQARRRRKREREGKRYLRA